MFEEKSTYFNGNYMVRYKLTKETEEWPATKGPMLEINSSPAYITQTCQKQNKESRAMPMTGCLQRDLSLLKSPKRS